VKSPCKKYRIDRLKSQTYAKLYQEVIKGEIQRLEMGASIELNYQAINRIVLYAAEMVLGVRDGGRSYISGDALAELRRARRYR